MDIFDRLFTTFQRRAFRLETLETYRVAGGEWEEFQEFVAGVPLPKGANAGWAKDVAGWTAGGKAVVRVRVLPAELNPYLQYELDWCYPFSLRAGEDIRFISTDRFKAIMGLNDQVGDFWLFDEASVLELQYGSDGSYLGERLVEDRANVAKYVTMSEGLLSEAIPATELFRHLRERPIRWQP